MDPKREELIRLILEARILARGLDDRITDFALELSLKEAMRDVSPKEAASLGLRDTGW
jgi:hypothetical protein